MAPLESFANAIRARSANLIVPADDLAVRHLHQLYDSERRRGRADGPICALIERSLGAPESFPVLEARSAVMELAREEGVRVPKTAIIANLKDLGIMARMHRLSNSPQGGRDFWRYWRTNRLERRRG